jgi:alpha/beta superfamily hydrolase
LAARAFERPATIALPPSEGEGLALDGLFVASPLDDAGGAVIAPPHPLMGGSMESPVVTEIALACQKAGLASLRFNWRGVGASAGSTSGDAAVADVDYASALAFLVETVPGPITACGYSFGAAAAVRSARLRPGPRRLLLVAPPPSLFDTRLLRDLRRPVCILVGDEDRFIDHEELASLAADLPAVHFTLLRGCDHFFMNGLGDLRRAMDAWLGEKPTA